MPNNHTPSLVVNRAVDEQHLSPKSRIPNKETQAAIAELVAGEGKTFDSIEEFMADLNAED